MAELAKAQNGEQRIAGSSHTWGVSPFFHLQILKYRGIIALVGAFYYVNITVRAVLLGQLKCC